MSNATDIGSMFKDCKATTIDVSTWNTSNVSSLSYVFSGCHVEELDVSSWDTSNVTNFKSAFFNMPNIRVLDLHNWTNPKSTDFTYFISTCPKLEVVDISGFTNPITKWNYCNFIKVNRIKFPDTGVSTSVSTFKNAFAGSGNPHTLVRYEDDTFTQSPMVKY